MTPIYDRDGIVLYHGDCLAILPTLDPVDHVITDPPYSPHTHAKQWIGAALTAEGKSRVGTKFTELGFPPLTAELRCALASWAAHLSRRWTLVFSDLEGAHLWVSELALELEYVRTCIWDKVDSAPQFTGDRPAASAEAIIVAHKPGKKVWNGGGRRNVFRHAVNGATQGSKPHPSTKPLPLMRELIKLFTDPGETILDPFAGSGTTLVAARELGRKAIGIEISEEYAKTAVRILEHGVKGAAAVKRGQMPLVGAD